MRGRTRSAVPPPISLAGEAGRTKDTVRLLIPGSPVRGRGGRPTDGRGKEGTHPRRRGRGADRDGPRTHRAVRRLRGRRPGRTGRGSAAARGRRTARRSDPRHQAVRREQLRRGRRARPAAGAVRVRDRLRAGRAARALPGPPADPEALRRRQARGDAGRQGRRGEGPGREGVVIRAAPDRRTVRRLQRVLLCREAQLDGGRSTYGYRELVFAEAGCRPMRGEADGPGPAELERGAWSRRESSTAAPTGIAGPSPATPVPGACSSGTSPAPRPGAAPAISRSGRS